MVTGIPLVEGHVVRLDRDLAALRHGVAGVHDEVHDHLLDVTTIDFDMAERRRCQGHELDVFPDDSLQHLVDIGEHVVQVEHVRLGHLLSAEHQKLFREVRGSLTGLADFLEIVAHAVIALQIDQHELAVAQDDGKDVVEVMSNAAREPAHGFHFLRLPKLLLRFAQRLLGAQPFGHIACEHQSGRSPVELEIVRLEVDK